jgi:hypothetical protein
MSVTYRTLPFSVRNVITLAVTLREAYRILNWDRFSVFIGLFQKREPIRDYLKTNQFLKKALMRTVP